MLTFKQYLIEGQSNQEINKELQNYINGSNDKDSDYDNGSTVKEIFGVPGKGIPKVLSDPDSENQSFNLVLVKNGKIFDGSGIIINTVEPFTIDIADINDPQLKPIKKLTVKINKKPDSNDIVVVSAVVS